MCRRIEVFRDNKIGIPGRPEIIIRRELLLDASPFVTVWIFGEINRIRKKFFYLGKKSFVRTQLGDKYDAQLTGRSFMITIGKPDLHGLCRDLKIRRIRIITTPQHIIWLH